MLIPVRFIDFIKEPQIMMPFLDLFAGLCAVGMIESMSEPHLRDTGASTLDIGLSFLGFGCCHMVGSMIFGQVIMYICNNYSIINFFKNGKRQEKHFNRAVFSFR